MPGMAIVQIRVSGRILNTRVTDLSHAPLHPFEACTGSARRSRTPNNASTEKLEPHRNPGHEMGGRHAMTDHPPSPQQVETDVKRILSRFMLRLNLLIPWTRPGRAPDTLRMTRLTVRIHYQTFPTSPNLKHPMATTLTTH